ncbi:DMT family transporter [Streptomyces sp. Qhu-G9]|uniref:DMT family transporter n=1 Tax=Streptomyces sp. Qhu-G9 TaxID=3452799 RepID=UPI0022AC3181|nr:DMT family transporter [Streptomyces aurantiacus]WAU83720.1 DMT family transporter [Streptomyces aurantiacus]
MSALVLSVVLSLVSAVAYAGGAIVQERVAATTPDRTYAPMHQLAWWAAVGLNALGGLLHVVALAYGPLSLVQPLGALTIVFALPMAALFVRRRAGATAWRGAIMATVGLAGLLALVGTADSQSLSSTQRVVVALVTGGAVVALMTAARAVHRHPAVRSVLLAIAAGVAFGMSSVFTKTVAVDWTGGVTLADTPSLAVIGVLATAGMLLSQASYRGAGLAAPLATLTVVNPIVAAAVGITMFGETFRHGSTGTVLALGCGVVAAGGLILLTTERISGSERTRPVPMPVPTETGVALSAAGTPAEAVPGLFEQATVLPGRPVSAERRISIGVQEKAYAAPGAWAETFAAAAVREENRAPAGARETAFARSGAPEGALTRADVPDGALTPAAVLASGRDGTLVSPPGSNGPPPPGDAPGGLDEAAWPGGPYYGGLPYLPLMPAPMVIRSCVKS